MLPLLKNISKYIYKEEKQKQKNKPISFIDNPLYKKQYIFFVKNLVTVINTRYTQPLSRENVSYKYLHIKH